MRRECREYFPCHFRSAIPKCITARAWRTCRDVCRERKLAISFDVIGGEKVPAIPGACATRNFTYLVRGPSAAASEKSWVAKWTTQPVRWVVRSNLGLSDIKILKQKMYILNHKIGLWQEKFSGCQSDLLLGISGSPDRFIGRMWRPLSCSTERPMSCLWLWLYLSVVISYLGRAQF